MDSKIIKYGIHGSEVDLSKIPDIKLPEPESDGRIRVFSDKGFATTDIMETSKKFSEFAASCKMPVFDIGESFGEATVASLKKGETVIANDLEENYLNYIFKRKELNDDDRKRLFKKRLCTFRYRF